MPGTELTFIVDSLNPETRYRVAVTAVNQHGIGPSSEDVYVETLQSIKARVEPTEGPGKPNTTKEGKTRQCVVHKTCRLPFVVLS